MTNIHFKSWLDPDNFQFDLLYFADLVPENETSGFIFIHAEGGLNQQRIAVCMCHFHNLCPLSRWHVTHELFHSLGLKRKMLM